MRRLLVLFICGVLLCTNACAETMGASDGRGLYAGDFVCAYCEESDTYWFIAPRYAAIRGWRIPLIPRQYSIYSMNGDFSNVAYHMSTACWTKNILPTANGLYYEREVALHPIAMELHYYNAATGKDKRIAPVQRLLAYTSDALIFENDENQICVRSSATGEERRYSINHLRYYTAEGLYYGDSFDNIQFYSYHTGQSTFVPNPESGIPFYAGYGHLLSETGHLYRIGEETELIADLGVFTSCAFSNEYACVFGQSSDSNSRGQLRYVRYSDPSHVFTMDVEGPAYWNINLCNNYVFFYRESDAVICAVELNTQNITYINLP